MNRKEIILLIGQKGSGKSFIGALLEKELGIRFIRVEDWAKRIKKDRAIDNEVYLAQVFAEIEKGIRENLTTCGRLVFESTGLTKYFDEMLDCLKHDFRVTTVAIQADEKTCIRRVRSRDQAIHINVSDEQVMMINEKVRERNFKTDLKINNDNRSETDIVGELRRLFG